MSEINVQKHIDVQALVRAIAVKANRSSDGAGVHSDHLIPLAIAAVAVAIDDIAHASKDFVQQFAFKSFR